MALNVGVLVLVFVKQIFTNPIFLAKYAEIKKASIF